MIGGFGLIAFGFVLLLVIGIYFLAQRKQRA